MRRHATPAIAAFLAIVGCLAARGCGVSRVAAWGGALAVVATGLGVTAQRLPRAAARRLGALALAAAMGACLGSLLVVRMEWNRRQSILGVDPTAVTSFSGRLREDSALSRAGNTVLRLRLVRAEAGASDIEVGASADVLLFVQGDWPLPLGMTVQVQGRLRPFLGEGDEQYAADVRREDIRQLGFDDPVWRVRASLREAVQRALARVGWPASGLLEALLIGSRQEVPEALQEGFRRTGSLHVLSLSGLHVGILFAFASLVLRPVPSRGVRFLAGVLLLAAYQVVAGFSASLVRSTVMIVAGGAARLLDRDDEPLNLLALAGIAILLADPWQASGRSFQLSFLALAGILGLGPVFARPLDGRVPPAVLRPLALSLGAQVSTLPVVLPAFGAWFPSGIVASLILVPLVAALLWLALAWLIVSPLAGAAMQRLAAAAFGALYAAIEGTTATLGRLPGVAAEGTAAIAAAVAAGAATLAVALFSPLPRRVRATC